MGMLGQRFNEYVLLLDIVKFSSIGFVPFCISRNGNAFTLCGAMNLLRCREVSYKLSIKHFRFLVSIVFWVKKQGLVSVWELKLLFGTIKKTDWIWNLVFVDLTVTVLIVHIKGLGHVVICALREYIIIYQHAFFTILLQTLSSTFFY